MIPFTYEKFYYRPSIESEERAPSLIIPVTTPDFTKNKTLFAGEIIFRSSNELPSFIAFNYDPFGSKFCLEYNTNRELTSETLTFLSDVLSIGGPSSSTLLRTPLESQESQPQERDDLSCYWNIARVLIRLPSALEIMLMLEDVKAATKEQLIAEVIDEKSFLETITELYKQELITVRGPKILITEKGHSIVEKLRKYYHDGVGLDV